MEHLPSKSPQETEKIVEGEIVGSGESARVDGGAPFGEFEEVPASFLRRSLTRVIMSLVIFILGLAMSVFGVILAVSIVGAFIGIPLIIAGLAMILGALWTLLGGGNFRMVTVRRGGF